MTLRSLHITVFALLSASNHAAATTLPDSVWYDSISGTRTHLQRTDTLVPYTCALHFFGRKSDGSPKLPALQALTEDFGINALILGYDHFVQQREWANVTSKVIKRNLKGGWVFDPDSFSGNQFAHPYHGSMFYNTAREHGLSYGVSLLYPLAGSLTWELFCETNRPAVNDLLSTGIGGAGIGEATHRISDIFFDDSKRGGARVVREIFGTLLNPVRGIHRMMSGEMFRVNHMHAGKKEEPMPYSFLVGVGDRYMYDEGPIHPNAPGRFKEHVPYLDFRFNYGSHFNHLEEGKSPRAYDYFNVYLLLNLDDSHPTVGELDIQGRIGSIQRRLPNRWQLDLGFYQNIKYIDHYNGHGVQKPGNLPIISEAASFGGDLFTQRQGRATTFSHSLMLSAVPLGGAASDYFLMRRYNFGTGFSLRHSVQFTWNRHFTIGNDLYFLRLFILRGEKPEQIRNYLAHPDEYVIELRDGTGAWGDQGEQSVLQNRSYLRFNLARGLHLNLQYEYNLRHGNYRYYPSVTGKSHEWKAGISYAL
ncbi:MAG: DUF3943 domain-containing protein [Bacteroidaceae bacterium]|nr:DUF3943 domain-containing protein [Bacteroidaceae bacterium]